MFVLLLIRRFAQPHNLTYATGVKIFSLNTITRKCLLRLNSILHDILYIEIMHRHLMLQKMTTDLIIH